MPSNRNQIPGRLKLCILLPACLLSCCRLSRSQLYYVVIRTLDTLAYQMQRRSSQFSSPPLAQFFLRKTQENTKILGNPILYSKRSLNVVCVRCGQSIKNLQKSHKIVGSAHIYIHQDCPPYTSFCEKYIMLQQKLSLLSKYKSLPSLGVFGLAG